ncbi:hypothetical protein ACRAVF_27320 [Bradyrhizobium oligotrophicum S58]
MINWKSFTAGLVLAALSLTTTHAQGVGQLKAGQVWGNPSASEQRGVPSNVTAILDQALGSTRGAILERGLSTWGLIAPAATAGLPFVSNGTGADPTYRDPAAGRRRHRRQHRVGRADQPGARDRDECRGMGHRPGLPRRAGLDRHRQADRQRHLLGRHGGRECRARARSGQHAQGQSQRDDRDRRIGAVLQRRQPGDQLDRRHGAGLCDDLSHERSVDEHAAPQDRCLYLGERRLRVDARARRCHLLRDDVQRCERLFVDLRVPGLERG